MNFQNFMDVKKFIKAFVVLSLLTWSYSSFADWKIDLSRRAKHIGVQKYIEVIPKEEKKEVFKYYYSNKHPIQELVIMNTKKGFVPESVSLKSGVQYRVHLINVDKDVKNSSFVMPGFSQYHSMYYGNSKSFIIHPKKEGVFKFESPETQKIGKIIVHGQKSQFKTNIKSDHIDLNRGLASDGE